MSQWEPSHESQHWISGHLSRTLAPAEPSQSWLEQRRQQQPPASGQVCERASRRSNQLIQQWAATGTRKALRDRLVAGTTAQRTVRAATAQSTAVGQAGLAGLRDRVVAGAAVQHAMSTVAQNAAAGPVGLPVLPGGPGAQDQVHMDHMNQMDRLLADALQRAEKAEQAAEQKDSLLDLMELQCGHLKTQKHSLEMGLERQSAALARMTSERDSLAFLLQNETNARTAAKTRAAFEIVSGLRALYCKWVACRVL